MAIKTWSPAGLFGGGFTPPAAAPGTEWVQTGTKRVPLNNAPKNAGHGYRTVPIYTQTPTAPPPAAAAPAAPKLTIRDLYQTVLGRDPDEEGASYWQNVFGPDIDATEAAAFGLAASKELNPPQQAYSSPTTSPLGTPYYEEPPQADFASMFAQMQAQNQAQLEQVVGGLMQTIGQIQQQMMDESGARQADIERMREAQRTYQINQARSQAAGNFEIQGVPSDSSIGGTKAFKIRNQKLGLINPSAADLFTSTLNL